MARYMLHKSFQVESLRVRDKFTSFHDLKEN